MRVVQIVGMPYSGSTVMGYILNAAPGWFFGSEVYRLLPSHPAAEQQVCAFCGEDCPAWTAELRAELLQVPGSARVDSVYEAFARRHPDVEVFVDGSNGVERYVGVWSDTQVVVAKHPIRLVSSHLYNRPKQLGLKPNLPFPAFREALRHDPDLALARARRVLRNAVRNYREVLERAPAPHIVRTDELDRANFAELERLREHLGSPHDRDSVLAFSRDEVHPIGGNKAPLWQRLDANAGPAAEAAVGHQRREYYAREAGQLGDYRVDDKWREQLPAEVVAQVSALPAYRQLAELLGYEVELPASR